MPPLTDKAASFARTETEEGTVPTQQEQHDRHVRSAEQIHERLGLPAGESTALAWFDGSHRKIVLWIKTKSLRRVAIEIPLTFDGYPVQVEKFRVARALSEDQPAALGNAEVAR